MRCCDPISVNHVPSEKALVVKGPPVKPGESADEYERVHMDPIYDYIRGLETEHGDDALWSAYFPRQPTLVRWKKVHPMDRVRAKAEMDTAATHGKDGKKNMSSKSLRRLGNKKKKKSEEATNDEAGVSRDTHSVVRRSESLEPPGINLSQWRMLACFAPMISTYKAISSNKLTLSDNANKSSQSTSAANPVNAASSDSVGKTPGSSSSSRSSMKGPERKLKSSGGSMVTFQLDNEDEPLKDKHGINVKEEDDEGVVKDGEGGNRLVDYEAGDRKWQGAVEPNRALLNQSDGSSRDDGGGNGGEDGIVAVTPGSYGMKPSTANNLAATPQSSTPGIGGRASSFTPLGGRSSSGALGRPSTTAGSGQPQQADGGAMPRGWTADEEGHLLGDTDVVGAKALLAENRRNDADFKTTGLILQPETSADGQSNENGATGD